ncbi:unnamed protein product [Bursaphelenchus xylophilus]|uniref:(pine wood nematode) hypothetical protein n=1 Tax=Bursaphelenchus xylophilus TaxID=6326 RepID=A0A1I7SC42_BURXY|nr:unnamed protein product [Bursaphelenchus xylophilus]CAG9125130.1 unnamed protein product [Bursaphelenchus xylophilus]
MSKEKFEFQGMLEAEEEEKMNVIEFIKSMDQLKLDAGKELEKMPLSELRALKNEKEMNGPRRLLQRRSREQSPSKSDEAANSTVWRKNSAEVKTSLRKMAFKNNRQETFHSLAMCSDNVEMCMDTANSSSAASLNEDIMRMPFVEAGRVSQSGRSSDSAPSPPNTASKAKDPSKRRVLHTIEQPDGSTVAFCTEIAESAKKAQEKKK